MDLEEASANLDSADLIPLFKRIQPLFESGLSDADVNNVVNISNALEVDQEREFEFTVRFDGKDVLLRIRVVTDDVGSPDVYFHSTSEVAERIQQEIAAYAEEHGR